ncbi:phenazine biosynthesis protein PhzF [Pseudoalteromonas sp. KS88]|uniref:PhzF family phenazine biosynthesis protein n=1 Tax=Pseudoalteromonas sp. KS88 TaxID=2109918 RepID=UPI001080AA75|nr:PhzF family phenazine biosynthesis protein [Pseudoalteromonas sp. KS88]TGE85218.1 phenazine biosynthesis protein PhzF [Pseudoalteromonas sp. KS88]
MNIEVILVNSFTLNGQGGNPAGVVLNADKLTDKQKLKIAHAVGYSETAFVSSDDEADFAVSFFTTTDEVDFCGHATLATFSTLYQKGLLAAGTYTQRTKVGILPVTIEPSGKVIMAQQLPQTLACFSYHEIAPVIGIESSILQSTQLPIEVISTGLPDVIIPVPYGYLDLINPNDELIAAFCKKYEVVGFHVFELCSAGAKLTASCRNFAPLFGISEESATGSSSGALACYLTEHLALGSEYVFEQGRAMGCTSIITASIESDNASVTRVQVGGFASIIDSLMLPLM